MIKHELYYRSSHKFYKDKQPVVNEIRYLYLYGFQNIIEDQFSHETYNFVAEQNGYYSNTSNASYLEQSVTYLIDFGDITYKTLAGGFDMFCYSLALELLNKETGIVSAKKKGGIYLKHELMNVVKAADGRYELTFSHNGQDVKILAKNIILGMPRRSL